MKKEVIEYYCDVCGKKVASEKHLETCVVPSKNYDCEGKSWTRGTCKADLCSECAEAFFKATMNHFAEINNGYMIESKVKYKNDTKKEF